MHTPHILSHWARRDGRCCGWYLAGLSGIGEGISCTIGWGDGVSPVGLVCHSKCWLCFRLSSRDLEHKQQQQIIIKKEYCLDHSGLWVQTWHIKISQWPRYSAFLSLWLMMSPVEQPLQPVKDANTVPYISRAILNLLISDYSAWSRTGEVLFWVWG